MEAAVKRAKHDRHLFQSKGNKQTNLKRAKDAFNVNAISKAKSGIEEGIALVSKRMKVIKIADKS